jgi:hypothetical protein
MICHPSILAAAQALGHWQAALYDHVARLTPACRRNSVEADLTEDWVAALRKTGFDPSVPTEWQRCAPSRRPGRGTVIAARDYDWPGATEGLLL